MSQNEKIDQRVGFFVTRRQREFLDKHTGKRGMGELLRWLLDNHIHQVEKQNNNGEQK